MDWTLHTTKLLTPIVVLLLIVSIVFAVSISLSGRLGSISGLVGAFFWSVILLVLVMPWQEILQNRFACGAMYDLHELTAETRQVLTRWGAVGVTPRQEHLYYARLAGMPGVALLVWLVVAAKFAAGCKGLVAQDSDGDDRATGNLDD